MRSFINWDACKQNVKQFYGGKWYKKTAAWSITIVLSLLITFIAIDLNLFYLFGSSPTMTDIENHSVSEASEIYSADGKLMGRYFNENRSPVEFNEISPILIRTLIDTEDERFYEHHGIDFTGLLSAMKDIAMGHTRGASTITQQLAKNMFRVRTKYSGGLVGHIPGIKLLLMKAKEWIVAVKLEALFTKEEILTMYLNTVDFGSNSYGIKTAARTYFGTVPANLNYEQSAILVGLLKATSSYNPRLNPKNSLNRRNTVLDLVFEHHHIYLYGQEATPLQLDSLKGLPIKLATKSSESRYDGIAPHFREALMQYIDDLTIQGEIPGYNAINKLDLYADGLKIYTTLDTRLQKYAEDAVNTHLRLVQKRFDDHWGSTPPWRDRSHNEIPNFIEDIAKKTDTYKILSDKFNGNSDSINYYINLPHQVRLFSYDGPLTKEMSTMDSIRYMVKFMHCGFIVMEPNTREVKAWVGDVDFDSWKYDKVLANRQPGSTFKLFVYTEAMNQGLTPCEKRRDSWVAYNDTINGKIKTWAPHNANGYFTDADMPLKCAFAQSVNSVAVKIGMEVGIKNIIKTAHAMGIQSPLDEAKALSLGCSDVNLYELTNSYCTVIDEGNYCMPIMITKIEDKNGNLVYRAKTKKTQAIPYTSAYLMQRMLRGGLTEPGGTSASLWSYIRSASNNVEFGGKTGTSNNHSDAWFIGVSPKLVGGVWVGGEYRSIHFRTGEYGQGSRMALPVFGHFIKKVLEDKAFSKYKAKFPEPKNIDSKLWTCSSVYTSNDNNFENDTSAIAYPKHEDYFGSPSEGNEHEGQETNVE